MLNPSLFSQKSVIQNMIFNDIVTLFDKVINSFSSKNVVTPIFLLNCKCGSIII